MIPTILFSSNVSASNNIARHLINMGFSKVSDDTWAFKDITLIDTKVDFILDIPTDVDGDYIIVLSPHRSEKKLPALTTHIPGNWTSADFRGDPFTLNIALPSVKVEILKSLAEYADEFLTDEWLVSFEVDHHGPTINKPIIFVEIGSGEEEWNNEQAGMAVAHAVFDVLKAEVSGGIKRRESFFGIGGGHYAPKFTKLALNEDMPFGHMLPKYKVNDITFDVFSQAIEKSVDEVKAIVMDKKGLNSTQRKKILEFADQYSIDVIKR